MKLFVVVVLYKMLPAESPTLVSLNLAAKELKYTDDHLSILVWDNTPGGQTVAIDPGMRYRAAPNNPGLSQAYNEAIRVAKAGGYEWLLTLDQDTSLPSNFLASLASITEKLARSKEVASIVPRISGDGRNISPFHFIGGAIPHSYRAEVGGVLKDAVFALNSAATHRVSALCELGGYNLMFPLDISDLDLFHRLHCAGKRVFIANDLIVSHEFSLLKKHTRMNIDRYRSQLLDECAFWDQSMTVLARLERLIRLLGRYLKDRSNPHASAFRKETLAEFRRRLKTPRSKRVAQWKLYAMDRASKNGAMEFDCD